MGSGKHRWKISFHRSPSKPPTPTPSKPPTEFLCPISSTLMADPVIVPSGQTFERNCIQACTDLGFTPPSLSTHPSPFLLIPNHALNSAILNFCDQSGLPHPLPLHPDSAKQLVLSLIAATSHGKEELMTPNTPPSIPTKTPSCYSPPSSYYSSSSYSSDEITVVQDETLTLNPPTTTNCLEEEILAKLKNPDISEQEAALISLRHATRESRDHRNSLCTPRLLSALRPMLLSRYSSVQINATASVVNLSLESANKIPIVRSGAVPLLVDALKCGHAEARDHAAGALFSLALDDENKAAIGVLGAIPPLLLLFSRPDNCVDHRTRRDAGMALYHLSLSGNNRTKLVRMAGVVPALLGVAAADAAEGAAAALGRVAMMVLCNLTGSVEGRGVLMDAGAVEGVVALMTAAPPPGPAAALEEYCVAALYGMSRGSLRFRGLAKAAGAEEVLTRVAEDEGGGEEVGREMARTTLRAMRGEEEEELVAVEGSSVSDGMLSFRRVYKGLGNVSGTNSAEF